MGFRLRHRSGERRSRRWCRRPKSSSFACFPLALCAHFGANFPHEARHILFGVAVQFAGGAVFGGFPQTFQYSVGFIFAEGFTENFAHGAAFALGDGFCAGGEVGRKADGVDLRFARFGGGFFACALRGFC